MDRMILFLLGLFLFAPTAIRAEIYKYTDHRGVVTLSDSLSKVPPEFRNQVEVIGESDLAPVIPDSSPNFIQKNRDRLQESARQWVVQASDAKILISSGLAFFLLFFISKRKGGFFFKCAFLFSGLVLVASILYSFVIPREIYLRQSIAERIETRSARGISTIQEAKELNKDFAETEQSKKNVFQSIFQ